MRYETAFQILSGNAKHGKMVADIIFFFPNNTQSLVNVAINIHKTVVFERKLIVTDMQSIWYMFITLARAT